MTRTLTLAAALMLTASVAVAQDTSSPSPPSPQLKSVIEPKGPTTVTFDPKTCTFTVRDHSGDLVSWPNVCPRDDR